MKLHRIVRIVGLSLVLIGVCAAGAYRARQAHEPASSSLAGFAPPGALLAIESPDFAGLLRSWNN